MDVFADRLEAAAAGTPAHDPETDSLLSALYLLEPLRAAAPRAAGAEHAGLRRLLEQAEPCRVAVSPGPVRRLTGWWTTMKTRYTFLPKLITLALVAMLALGAGGTAVNAADDSLPTAPLYSLKLASEDLRLSLAASPAAQLALLLRYVETRTQEMTQLAARGEPVPDRAALRLQAHLEECLQVIAQQGDAEMAGDLERVREQLATQTRLMLHAQAQAPRDGALARAVAAMTQTQAMIAAGLQDPQLFRERVRAGAPETAPIPPDQTPAAGDNRAAGPGPGTGATGTPGQGPGPGPEFRPTEAPQAGGELGQSAGPGAPPGDPTSGGPGDAQPGCSGDCTPGDGRNGPDRESGPDQTDDQGHDQEVEHRNGH
jgi:hypothetical protein